MKHLFTAVLLWVLGVAGAFAGVVTSPNNPVSGNLVVTGSTITVSATNQAALVPTSDRKVMVIIGGSVASGSVSTFGGWPALLSGTLATQGWTVINKAVGGRDTNTVLANYYDDVVALHPQVCFINSGMSNDNMMYTNNASEADGVRALYVKNIQAMIRIGNQHGIKTVVGNVYPFGTPGDMNLNEYYTDYQQAAVRATNRDLEYQTDVPIINFLGAVDSGSCSWSTGFNNDIRHPNDKGSYAMFYAIPVGLFDRMLALPTDSVRPTNYSGSAFVLTSDTSNAPLGCNPPEKMESWTMSVWIRASAVDVGCAWLGAGLPGGSGRVNNPSNFYNMAFSGVAVTSTTTRPDDFKWHQLTFVHSEPLATDIFYIDGASQGTSTGATLTGTTGALCSFSIFGRLVNAAASPGHSEMKDWLIYRTALSPYDVALMYTGVYTRGSLELYCPLTDKAYPNGLRILNLAKSNSAAYVNANTGTITPANGNPIAEVSTNTPIRCAGAPGSVGVIGNLGDQAINTNGGTTTTLYIKESGAGASTGWVAK